MPKLVVLWFVLFVVQQLLAQELSCKVRINDVQVQISDKSIFRSLEQRLTEFVNNTKWTTETFSNQEKIDLNIEIILGGYDQNTYEYKASAIIQSRRPVFGSSYNTTLFSFNDDNFDFKYQDQDRMDYQEGVFTNDVVSYLSFYVNFVLGMDFDSFGQEGGTIFFNRAFQIANIAQQTSVRAGWKPFERTLRTRYNLIDNMLNPRFAPMRQAIYLYHRKGLDQMVKDPFAARKQIMLSLTEVKKVFKIAPNTVGLLIFFEAKSDELVSIYKGADDIEKPKAVEILSEINVGNLNKYEKIRGG
jgi:hypothetical protein